MKPFVDRSMKPFVDRSIDRRDDERFERPSYREPSMKPSIDR